MQKESADSSLSGWREGLLAAGVTGIPVLVVLATVPASRATHPATVLAGVVAGVLLLIAALTFYFHWLTTPTRRRGWTTSAMVVLATQVLVSSGRELANPTTDRAIVWSSAIDLLATAMVLALMLLGARAVANPQPLLFGLVLSFVLTMLDAFGPVGYTWVAPSAATSSVLLVAVLCGHLAIAWLVMQDHNLVEWARTRLAMTVVLVGIAHVARTGSFENVATDLAAAIALVVAAVLWTSATFVLLRDALATQHRRSIALEGSLLEIESSLRGRRERMHEIRSTVAGAASASRLLDDRTICPDTHVRLERAIRTELDRLERLVTDEAPPSPGPVDLDATLDVLLEAHRARGRTVEWEPTGGAQVYARPDDVAEALNILLDNAATHGGNGSRVRVTLAEDVVEIAVSDEGPGVPVEAREEIFDWGVHGGKSPGQGIGLSVARRLVSEHGGSLTLAENGTARGSSFVIRLPAARRSEEGRNESPHVVSSADSGPSLGR